MTAGLLKMHLHATTALSTRSASTFVVLSWCRWGFRPGLGGDEEAEGFLGQRLPTGSLARNSNPQESEESNDMTHRKLRTGTAWEDSADLCMHGSRVLAVCRLCSIDTRLHVKQTLCVLQTVLRQVWVMPCRPLRLRGALRCERALWFCWRRLIKLAIPLQDCVVLQHALCQQFGCTSKSPSAFAPSSHTFGSSAASDGV